MSFSDINFTQVFTGLVSLVIVLGVIGLYLLGLPVPDVMLGAFGLVLGSYFRRSSVDDAIAQSERVLRVQSVLPGDMVSPDAWGKQAAVAFATAQSAG